MFENLNFSNKNIFIGVVLFAIAVSVLVIFLAKCFPLWTFNELTSPPKGKRP